MAVLRRFKDTFDLQLSDDALGSENPIEHILFDGSSDTEIIEPEINIDKLDVEIQKIINNIDKYSTEIDKELTIPLHKILGINRVQAADYRLWSWLGLIKYPELVCHRWRKSEKKNEQGEEIEIITKDRFYGSNRVRHTFSRLWWAAELTVNANNDYTDTKNFIGLSTFQDLNETIFGRSFCAYKPAIKSFIDVLGKEDQKIQREVAKEINYLMTTIVLESCKKDELDELLESLTKSVKSNERKT